MDPFITGGLISGGVSLLGNALGMKSQADTNRAMVEVNRQNNQFNSDQAGLNRQWNKYMWDENNRYNSPEEMIKRGLNPYSSGNSGAGVSSSPAQGSQASSAGMPSLQAFHPDFSTVGSVLASFAQARESMTNADNARTMLPHYVNQTLGNTNWRNIGIGQSGYWNASTGRQSAILDQSRERQELQNLEFASRLTQAQETQIRLSSEAQQVLNKYLDVNQQADLFIKNQTLSNLKEAGRLTISQYKTELQKAILVAAQAKGQKISNKVAADTADSLIYATYYENTARGLDALWDSKNVNNRKSVDYSTKKAYRDILKKEDSSYYLRNAVDYGTRLFQGVGNTIGVGRRSR